MIPPDDYTPYLVGGNLRTPEDVLKWIERRLEVRVFDTVGEVYTELSLRLDAERRQACKRASFLLTRGIAAQKRWLRRDYKRYGRRHFGTFAEFMVSERESRWGVNLRRALAFRAAAKGGKS